MNEEPADILERIAEMMNHQNGEMNRLLEHQTQLLEALQRPDRERRVEGISMPVYHGKLGESLLVFLQQVKLYLNAKNIDVDAPNNQGRLIAMVASNLRRQAAAWYTFHQGDFRSLTELVEGLRGEFIPPDLQERLRGELLKLKQSSCESLEDYVARFRHIICQVEQMSELDQITWFVHGLVTRTQEEVAYRRCASLSKAISVALEFERAHPHVAGERSRPRPEVRAPRVDDPEPMEIGVVRVRLSREECRRRNLCFRCQRSGHRMNQCPLTRPRKNVPGFRRGPRRQINSVTVTASDRASVTAASVSPTMAFEGYNINMVKVVQPGKATTNTLIRKSVAINGKPYVALIDSGADHNMIRPGITVGPGRAHVASIEGFDGVTRENVLLHEVKTTILMEDNAFSDVQFTEYPLPESHDLILGKPWLTRFNPRIDWQTHDIHVNRVQLQLRVDDVKDGYWYVPLTPNSVKSILPLAQSSIALYHVKTTMQTRDEGVHKAYVAALLGEFRDVFPAELPHGLPPTRSVEFELQLKPDATPSSKPPFRLSRTEQEALQEFVDSLLAKQWIELSSSPWVSNVFGVPKKDTATGKAPSRAEWIRSGDKTRPIRWVVDYRYLNSQTLVPKIPLPNIEDLFDKMNGAVVFSVIDLAQGYHQMRVKPSSRPYTAFRTQHETYQWCVAPMGVAGMPGIWSRLMRVLFGKFAFVVVYLDDICVFSRTEAEHEHHLRAVFEVLRSEKLYAREVKCTFAKSSVNFLGHTISADGLQVDQQKTAVIEQWPRPQSVRDLLGFLGLAGYYRRFIHRFADIVLPLSSLVKKNCVWEWTEYQENAFLMIKAALQQAPVLRLPDFDKPFVVTTDASQECCGGVLSQRHDGFDHPVAFYSKKLSEHERKWPAHEKELFAIKLARSKWRHYVHGRPFSVYTDNIACRWFLHHPRVSAKLARWLDFFAQFDFQLHHVEGVQNIVADALSRHIRRDDGAANKRAVEVDNSSGALHSEPSADASFQLNSVSVHQCGEECVQAQAPIHKVQNRLNVLAVSDSYDLHLVLNDDHPPRSKRLQLGVAQECQRVTVNAVEMQATTVQLATDSVEKFKAGYERDPFYSELPDSTSVQTKYGTLYRRQGLMYLHSNTDGHGVERLCVPDDDELRTSILAEFHDGAAHPGVPRTLSSLNQWYFWPEMQHDVHDYVSTCITCLKFKVSSKRKQGMMIPIAVPTECWEVVGLDYISGLPESRGYDAIQVAVDLLSKRAKYAPTNTTADAQSCARTFFDSVIRHHGVPRIIVSDRDSRFTGKFWQELMKLLGVKLHMTTAHRAQADGQVERQNRVLEDALRCLVSQHGDDWVDHLGTIEYAHATLASSSTKLTPFEVDCGRAAANVIERTQGESTDQRKLQVTRAEFAKQFVERRRRVVEEARCALLDAKAKQKETYDRHRSEAYFKAGDLVLLRTDNLPLKRVAHDTTLTKMKLAPRMIGPFAIDHMVNENAARLKLPHQLRQLHPTFNVELLEHCPEQPERFRTRPPTKATPIEVEDTEDDDLRVIERLLKRRQFNRQPEYLVKWLGEPESESTWERERDIKHVMHWKKLLTELRNSEAARRNSTRGECEHPVRQRTHTHVEDVDFKENTHPENLGVSVQRPRRSHTRSQTQR